MEYYRRIGDRDVWVTVDKPFVLNEENNQYVESPRYCCAFKFDKEPGVIVGQYLREGDELRWFASTNDAATAAFAEATQRLNE